MVLVIAAVLLALILIVAIIAVRRTEAAERTTATRVPRDQKLPAGADAALWSIVEVVPDPRNHLALTRDLTGEVRISGTLLDPEFRASTIAPPPRPAPAGGASVRIIGQRPVDDDVAVGESTDEHRLDVAS